MMTVTSFFLQSLRIFKIKEKNGKSTENSTDKKQFVSVEGTDKS